MKTITVTYEFTITGDAPDEVGILHEIEDHISVLHGCRRAYGRVLRVDRNLPTTPDSRG